MHPPSSGCGCVRSEGVVRRGSQRGTEALNPVILLLVVTPVCWLTSPARSIVKRSPEVWCLSIERARKFNSEELDLVVKYIVTPKERKGLYKDVLFLMLGGLT